MSDTKPVPPGWRLTIVAFKVGKSPAGVLAALTVTIPEKPFRLVSLMTVEFGDPGYIVRLVWLAEALKSRILTGMVMVAENGGVVTLVPMTLICALPVWVLLETVRRTFLLPPALSTIWVIFSCVNMPQGQPLSWSDRFTVPLNSPILTTVIVVCADELVGIFNVGGTAEIVNPPISTVTFTDMAVVPFRAVTVITKLPVVELVVVMFSVEETPHWLQGGTTTVDGLRVTVGAEGPDGETVAVRGMGPEKRLEVLMVMLEVADLPGVMVTAFGLALIESRLGGVLDILQAVRGCISHPEKLWLESSAWSGSQ
jgi:hypothetical protein